MESLLHAESRLNTVSEEGRHFHRLLDPRRVFRGSGYIDKVNTERLQLS
jgi:hypothetical protein